MSLLLFSSKKLRWYNLSGLQQNQIFNPIEEWVSEWVPEENCRSKVVDEMCISSRVVICVHIVDDIE